MSMKYTSEKFDVVVIGCGPGGAVAAAYLARTGLSLLLLEKEQFPRYHVGESLSGVITDILDDFDLVPQMARYDFPIKGGAKIMGRGAQEEFFIPLFRQSWQVRRDEFDQMLLDNAIKCGAIFQYGTVKDILRDGEKVVGVSYQPQNSSQLKEVFCRMIVDASGRAKLLSKKGIAGSVIYEEMDRQAALFTQFKGARRDPGRIGNDNTFIFYSKAYHWAWFIPLSPDVVSVGVVMPTRQLKACGGAEKAWQWGLENINPDLKRRVKGGERVEKVRAITNYSYRVEPFAGEGWLCIGDAHRFIDPIFSLGVAFAMLEGREASRAILKALETGDWTEPFAQYTSYSDRAQNAALDLTRYFWSYPHFFGFLTRGKLRKDLIRFLSSDFQTPHDFKSWQSMHKSLNRIHHS